MEEKEVQEAKTYIRIKGFDGIPVLEVELESLASLIQFLAQAINSGQIEVETKMIRCKRFMPKLSPHFDAQPPPFTVEKEERKDE